MGDHECTKEVAETTKDKCALFADSHFQQERTNNAKLINDLKCLYQFLSPIVFLGNSCWSTGHTRKLINDGQI